MSGPVRPPLTVAESDGNPTVRPVNTISFNSADFTLADQGGGTVRVDVNPGGGTSLTATQIGFGDGSNLLTGDSVFTYTTPSSHPTVTIGDSTLQDQGGNFRLQGKDNVQILSSSTFGSIKFYPGTGSSGSAMDIAYTGMVNVNPGQQANGDFKVEGQNVEELLRTDASQDNIGLGGSPDSGVERLHVLGTGTDTLVRLESTNAGSTQAPDLELFRNSASPADADYTGAIAFTGYEDTAASSKVTYARIDVRMFGLDANESGAMTLYTRQNNANRPQISMNQTGVKINENHESVFDFVVESNESSAGFHNIYADSGQNNVGLGCVPDSGVERLHIKGTGTDDMVRIESTEPGNATAPDVVFYRSSASPTANDFIGRLDFRGKDSAGNDQDYGVIAARILSETGGSEDGAIYFKAAQNGDTNLLQPNLLIKNTEVSVNDANASYINFIVKGNNSTLISCQAGQDNVGIGSTPSSTGAQFQVNGDASFKSEIINDNSTTILTSAEVKNSKIISNPSGSDATITLPAGEAGMRVTVVNVSSSNTVTVAFNASDSSIEAGAGTHPRALTQAQNETWLCYKDNNWVLENFI